MMHWTRATPFLILSFIAQANMRGQGLAQSQQRPESRQSSPVVVELFTSEGCSDCPPADDLLNGMVERQPAGLTIIPLAFHVTYWDTHGWRDRFSDLRYTERQEEYERQFHIQSPYTPQSVIDGHDETVGNDAGKLFALIRRAAQEPKPVAVVVSADDHSLNVAARAADPRISGTVLLAITEDGLSTEVKAGENRSRTLHHDAVVRSLENLGKLENGAFSRTVRLRLRRGWQRNTLHAVIVVQDKTGRVLGAGTATLQGKT